MSFTKEEFRAAYMKHHSNKTGETFQTNADRLYNWIQQQLRSESVFLLSKEGCRETLKDELKREPTEDEVKSYWDWLNKDIGQWLTDNTKSWLRDCYEGELPEDNVSHEDQPAFQRAMGTARR
jgi:hypothetical protein